MLEKLLEINLMPAAYYFLLYFNIFLHCDENWNKFRFCNIGITEINPQPVMWQYL